MRVTPAIPARQRVHPIIKDLLDRLEQRFIPVKWLANNIKGVSIPVAKTIYIVFLRSLVDYLSPALCHLSKTSLQPLEKFQNKVMQFILGCPASTRIVNMLSELNLKPLVDRIYTNVTYFSIKCLRSPHLAPHYSCVIRAALDPVTPRLSLRPGGRTLVCTVCAACAVFSPTMEPPGGDGWVGRRLPNASSSTYCELNGLLDAVTILTERGLDGVIVCDSKSALHVSKTCL
ncbi:uncharacterized protein LOC123511337 [Portunus trituberculatus]|uniref:uncharacterized protein LOC123511337 n=1 Tax=Portunus trituberculatus TaxID=210409 RepID=UPI001E1CF39E|nr:uncharacterized protein LOC123511337 [Portunus trituberculatus]XP_045123074.1 uncharacterized protein LOC123511337 [Portunus trituberculatus]